MPAELEERPAAGHRAAEWAGAGDVPGKPVGEDGHGFAGAGGELLEAYAGGKGDHLGRRARQRGAAGSRAGPIDALKAGPAVGRWRTEAFPQLRPGPTKLL
ncbi:hypothetical protein GCM10010443_72860 [Actinoplanes cyaneus]